MSVICRLCGDTDTGSPFVVHEMMFGTREPFDYVECASCGSISIAAVPADLGRHYPTGGYYSMVAVDERGRGSVRAWLDRRWIGHLMGRPNVIGALLTLRRQAPAYIGWLRRGDVALTSRILDIGCGRGHLLHEMSRAGFTDLTGIDPFLEAETERPGVRTLRRDLAEMDGEFDVVMAHHALEHMADPAAAIVHMARLTRPGGLIVIRVPVAGSSLWATYGTDWVALDAPRHLCIPSAFGMDLLRQRAGLERAGIDYDATSFSILASRQYQLGIPLHDSRSVMGGTDGSLFGQVEVDAAGREIAVLNQYGESDTAAFFFRKPS